MNIALPRTRTGKAPYMAALFAACALAVVAAVGVWQATDFGTSSSAPAARSLPYHFTPSQTSLLLYMVDSDAQADMIRWGENEAANERASSGIADPGYSVIILNVATPEDERNVAEIVENWTASNSTVNIFDWRGR